MIMLKTKKSGENGDGVYLYMLCVVAINKKYFRKFLVGYCVLSENKDFFDVYVFTAAASTVSATTVDFIEGKCFECKVYS